MERQQEREDKVSMDLGLPSAPPPRPPGGQLPSQRMSPGLKASCQRAPEAVAGPHHQALGSGHQEGLGPREACLCSAHFAIATEGGAGLPCCGDLASKAYPWADNLDACQIEEETSKRPLVTVTCHIRSKMRLEFGVRMRTRIPHPKPLSAGAIGCNCVWVRSPGKNEDKRP